MRLDPHEPDEKGRFSTDAISRLGCKGLQDDRRLVVLTFRLRMIYRARELLLCSGNAPVMRDDRIESPDAV